MSSEDPREELTKEVFAHYGRTYYLSECLHRGLCNLFALSNFENSAHITKPRFEENLVSAFSLTLGQIIKILEDSLPLELFNDLQGALEKRNFLAHHFWFWRCHLMTSLSGLNEMLNELFALSDLFQKLDKQIEQLLYYEHKKLGIENHHIEAALNAVLAGNPMDSLPDKRFSKKSERIIKVWDVPIASGGTTVIFETEDGCLWQLCDIGLCWTNFDQHQADWKIIELIQKHLPVNINPRPPTSKPWNYEFKLKDNAIFWVKPSETQKAFKWGIRESS